MKRYAFKVFYIGTPYQGYQKQSNGRAIENALELAFVKAGYIESFSTNNYRGTSRTDAGVNAIENVFVLDLEIEVNLPEINRFLPRDTSIIIWAYSQVSRDFNPRKKAEKLYHYFVPNQWNCNDLALLKQFEGRHDFSAFIKKEGAGEYDPFTNIFQIKIEDTKFNGKVIQIIGDSFGREQIRRMIGFILYKKHFEITIPQVLTKQKLDIRPAPANFLCLQNVIFPVNLEWRHDSRLDYLVQKHTMLHGQRVDITDYQSYFDSLFMNYFNTPR